MATRPGADEGGIEAREARPEAAVEPGEVVGNVGQPQIEGLEPGLGALAGGGFLQQGGVEIVAGGDAEHGAAARGGEGDDEGQKNEAAVHGRPPRPDAGPGT
ncbi:MAG: hypothetical protein R3D98_07695 [Candidatus Krumholzibacteriia bacterium]